MVDTGLAAAFPGLKDAVCAIGHGPETVDLVMLTHEHADHVGGAALIPANATIAAHPQAANKLVLQDDFATARGVIGEDLAQFPIHLWLPEGSVIDAEPYRFEVLHTPGHTSGSICLMDKRHDLLRPSHYESQREPQRQGGPDWTPITPLNRVPFPGLITG